MKLWQVAIISVAAGITLPALAQMVESPTTRAEVEASVRDRLGKLDGNKDGTVTHDEIMTFSRARMEGRADDAFAAMDTDKNGSISRAEFDASRAKRGGRQIAQSERFDGPDVMMPPLPPAIEGQPMRERTRMMFMGGNATKWADGKGIVIADAVKKALDRFDEVDINKDGSISPEERRAQRGAWRAKRG